MNIWILTVESDFKICKNVDLFGFDVGNCDAQGIKETAKRNSSFLTRFDNSQLALWRTVGKKAYDELEEALKNDDQSIVERIHGNERVGDLGLTDGEILVIQILDSSIRDHPVTTIVDESSKDQVDELKEYTRYKATLAAPGKPPSMGAKSTEYLKSQGKASLAIHDGRRGRIPHVSTIAPPIQIFHAVFHTFTESLNDPHLQPTVEDLDNVYLLMRTLSTIYGDEDGYHRKVRKAIGRVLNTPISEVSNPDGSRPDGTLRVERGNISIPYAFFEMKREAGEGGCDPTSQASLSMKRGWIDKSVQPIREMTCCPTFLIAAGGPWLNIMGGVFTDKIIVQRLTGFRWMAISSTEEDFQIYDNARVLVALRKCLKELKEFYEAINVPALIPNKPHPRYFPYPTLFSEGGTNFSFQYKKSLEDDPSCVTYLAEIIKKESTTDPAVKVVVKFVTNYGRDVHEFLAEKGWAPKLRYYKPLWETTLRVTLPVQFAPAGLRLNVMHMVVMDYVEAHEPPPDALQQVREVLTQLHQKGFVYGDLREPNILFKGGQVKFVDFDWCGRYDRGQADGQIESMNLGDGTYAYYPLTISRISDMWSTDMKPLTQIRPEHDLEMIDRLWNPNNDSW